jgi:hypothetical protein
VSERDIQRGILDALAEIQGVLVWRNNTGTIKRNGRFVRFGIVGQGDITGLLPDGRRLEIEVKTDKGPVSEEQLAFGERMRRHGGVWFVARSVQEAVDGVLDAMREKRVLKEA